MTTVSIYDDIHPIKKESGAPVSLYDELDIPSNNDPPIKLNNTPPNIPTTTTTSTYPQTSAIPPSLIAPPITNPNNKALPSILPQILNRNTYPPVNDHIDPSLTGVPLQHLATYQSHVLYVGGISWWVTDADIRRTFDQFGTIIDVKIHADKVNGKSKGYGYVEFDARELDAAVIAKEKLHGHILCDCRISVAFASGERVKGAEYTNTPVHIPRHKMNPMNPTHPHNAALLPKINPSLIRSHPHPHSHAHTATVIPTHTHSHPHNVLAAINNARNRNIGANNTNNVSILNQNNKNIAHTNSNNANPNANNSNVGGGNTIGLLSKFTDQAQLLALLNKTQKNRSSSRSVTGSRSRSRSRSRSKHSRRRRHGNSRKKRRHEHRDRDERRHGVVPEGERERDREKRRHKRRHRHNHSRSDREYRERDRHRSRKRQTALRSDDSQNNNGGGGGAVDGDASAGDHSHDQNNLDEAIPVTTTTTATLQMNVDQQNVDEDE